MSAIYMAVNAWTGTLGCGSIVKAEPPRLHPHDVERRELACARQAVEQRIGRKRCRDLHDDQVLELFYTL